MADRSTIEWTEVPGHPGYHASQSGELRGPSGRVLRPMVSESGHRYVITGTRRKLSVHHAVLLAYVGPRPDGQETRHLDGDPANNALSNLVWGTRLENMRDKARHGTERCGEDKPGHRLTAAQVASIRLDRRSSRAVGQDYGVSHTAVQRIRRGERWRAA